MVEAERREKGTVSHERRYYLTSLTDAATFGRAVRGHWGIENGLHWELDITFREDKSLARIGASAANFVVLRHIALNLLKQEQTAKVGIMNKRLKAGWDERYLLKVIAGQMRLPRIFCRQRACHPPCHRCGTDADAGPPSPSRSAARHATGRSSCRWSPAGAARSAA